MRKITSIIAVSLMLCVVTYAGQNVVVVLDDSGSMEERMRSQRVTKISAAKEALIAVLETLPDDANVGIVLLNGMVDGSSWVMPLGKVDMDKARQMIGQVRANGGTPLGHFMKIGTDELLKLRDADHYGNFRLLVVTDGEASDERLVERYLPDIKSRGISVDVIGVDMKSDHSLATRVDSYRRADDPKMLVAAVTEVFAEVSNEGGDASESDFEMLKPIPTEFASAAIAALSEIDNRPIGEKRNRDSNRESSLLDSSTSNGSGGQSSSGSPSFFTYIIVAVVVLGIINMIRSASRANR